MSQAVSVVLFAATLTACSPFKPACSPGQLAAIEREYQTEVIAHCYHADCDRAAIDEKYRAKRQQWVNCE
jgi:hypothetical protein